MKQESSGFSCGEGQKGTIKKRLKAMDEEIKQNEEQETQGEEKEEEIKEEEEIIE